MIRGVWTIATREIASLFRLPVGWIVVALYAFLSAIVFVQFTLISGSPATLRYFFAAAAWMMVPVAPAISMRLLAEETKSGTAELLRTAPVRDFAVALGKFLGAWLFLAITLAPTLVLPITLWLVSEPAPDPGPVATGYLVLLLFGGLCLGVGLIASSLTSSQTLAFLGTLVAIILALLLAGPVANTLGPRFGEPLRTFSVMARVNELSKGVLDTAAVAFFLIVIAWSIVVTAGVLESRRVARARSASAIVWGGFLIATTASAVLAGVLAHDHRARIDVTSTGEHRLGPRAERMVDLIDAPTELVFAVDRARSDARAADLVGDVLDAYDRSSAFITHRPIDLSTSRGLEQTDQLLKDLASREQTAIDRALGTLSSSAESMRSTAERMGELASRLDLVRDAIDPSSPNGTTNRAFFDQRAGLTRLGARTLSEQADSIEESLANPEPSTGLPAFDRLAGPAIAVWREQRAGLTDLAAQARAFAESELATGELGTLARAAAQSAAGLRDDAAVAQEQLERTPRIDAVRVARALETGEALLVVGPPELGVAAIDLETLLPSTEVLDRAGLSPAGFIGPRAQELVATAIGSLVRPERPIVVFTHGGRPGELLGSSDLVTNVVERLARSGTDAIEWAAAEEASPPALSSLDPTGSRPVVYLVISADSTQGSGEGRLNGAQRAEQLAASVQRVIDAGGSVLLSLNPSVFPTYGDADPMARLAEPFGIVARTGTPLLTDRVGPGGRQANPLTTIVPEGGDHPIAGASRGLRFALPWAIPMELTQTEDAQASAVVTIAGDDASKAWSESQWLRFWSTPAQNRPLMRNQPEFNSNADRRADRWIVAAAGERSGRTASQRIVVVGSNGWATDGIVGAAEQLVDGRITTRFPGNGTLLDASIAWLSGQDELIAPGADARPIATIEPLAPAQLTSIRWVLLGVVPGLILVVGASVRAIRG